MSLYELNSGSSTIQGARENQEDYSGQIVTSTYAIGFLPPAQSLDSRSDHFWYSFICDGHNGRQCADTLGSTFGSKMSEAAAKLAADAHFGDISNAMLASYCKNPACLFSDLLESFRTSSTSGGSLTWLRSQGPR